MNFFTRHVRPEWALVMVTALWGASFILLSISLKGLSPALLVALRFIGGALVMALILRSRLFNLRKEDWIAGFSAGSCIFLGYFLQTVGLQTISSSISAFLTALYVPFVPLFQLILFRKRPGLIVSCGILTAFLGMILIMDPSRISFSGNFGEWITIASACFCALEILVLSHFANKCDPMLFCFTQLSTVAMWSTLYCLTFEDIRFAPTGATFICLAILIGMIAFNQFAMSWAQKSVSATRAVLIYTPEPVFAGLIGWLVGEHMGWNTLAGGTLVVLSILVSSWLPGYLKSRKRLNPSEAS